MLNWYVPGRSLPQPETSLQEPVGLGAHEIHVLYGILHSLKMEWEAKCHSQFGHLHRQLSAARSMTWERGQEAQPLPVAGQPGRARPSYEALPHTAGRVTLPPRLLD